MECPLTSYNISRFDLSRCIVDLYLSMEWSTCEALQTFVMLVQQLIRCLKHQHRRALAFLLVLGALCTGDSVLDATIFEAHHASISKLYTCVFSRKGDKLSANMLSFISWLLCVFFSQRLHVYICLYLSQPTTFLVNITSLVYMSLSETPVPWNLYWNVCMQKMKSVLKCMYAKPMLMLDFFFFMTHSSNVWNRMKHKVGHSKMG